MNFTQKLYLAAVCFGTIATAPAALLFDNISDYENSVPGANVASTTSTPNTFMGAGYNLLTGASSINGFDVFPANNSGTSFNSLKITIYVWGSVNTGAINSSTPAFGNLLATYTFTNSETLNSGFYLPVEGNPVGVNPGITLTSPLSVPGTLIGLTFSYQGSTDGGATYNNVNNLTSLITGGTPPTVGSLQFNGYYRNANSENNGNFTSTLRSLGGTFPSNNQGLAVRVFGTTGSGNHQPVANAQSVNVQRDSSVNITLTGSDADSDPLTFNVATSPTHGSLSGAAPSLTYQPNPGFVGSDSFTFTVNDTHTDSVPATVNITVTPPPTGLVITPVWDSTILNHPSAAAIMTTINNAIQVYQTKYLDPINVTIKFVVVGQGLGSSSTFVGSTSYSTFYNALVADSKTTNDVVALASIPGGSSNPVNGSSSISLSTANGRALGLNMNPPPGSPDSTISLNMSIINITRPGSNPNFYDLQAVVSHEMDEALGSSSGLPGSTVHPVDLFRYSSAGVRNFTTAGDSAFFSIDGGNTLLVQYNQDGTGDYGDWWSSGSHTPRVQDAIGTPGAMPNLGVELTLLDVIGYDLAPPAPPAVFQSVGLSGGQISFTWSATYGRSYQVQYTTSLSSPNWQNTGGPVIAGGATASYSENLSGPQRFYRVGLLPQPAAAPAAGPGSKDGDTLIGPLHLETRYLLPASTSTTGLEPSRDSVSVRAPERAIRWASQPAVSVQPVK